MSDRYVEGADLILEIETGDPTFSSHTAKTIWYIEPESDGTAGAAADKLSVAGTAVAGEDGNSVNQGEAITLIPGVYVYWSTSTNAAGKKCASPAFEVLVEKEGTVRR